MVSVVALVVPTVAYVALRLADLAAADTLEAVLVLALPAGVAIACVHAAGRAGPGEREGWRMLALAATVWTLAAAGYMVWSVAAEAPILQASLVADDLDAADVGFLASAPLLLLAVGCWSDLGPAFRARPARMALDAALILASFTFLGWQADPYRTGTSFSDPRLAFDILVASAITFLLAHNERLRPLRTLLLTLGVLAIVDADLDSDPLWMGYRFGALVSTGWAIGFACLGCAAAVPQAPGHDPRTFSRVREALPLLPAVVVLVFATLEVLSGLVIGLGRVVLGVGIVFTIVARQFLLLETLLRSQRDTQGELGRRVEAETQRSAILRAVSHDLMNPLTPIRLQTRVLRTQLPGNDKAAHSLDVIDRNLMQVTRLTSDLLDMVRIQDARLRVDKTPLAVDGLAADVVADHQASAATRGLQLKLDVEPASALADAGRIRQVFTNLLGNALKFTPAGGTVTVRVRPEADGLRAEVADTGAGFTAEQGAKLFQPFSQVHDRGGQKAEDRGTGLGLFVCRGIVAAHGGAIGCTSPGPGQGATFWFTLPKGAG